MKMPFRCGALFTLIVLLGAARLASPATQSSGPQVAGVQTQNSPADQGTQDTEAEAKKAEIEDEIESLQSDIEDLQHEVEAYQDSADQLSSCSGIGAAICQLGAAKARANANKANNQIDEKRREIAQLRGDEVQAPVRRSTSTAAIYARTQMPQAPISDDGSAAAIPAPSSAGGAQPSNSYRDMTYCVKIVSSSYDANHFLHVIVRNTCDSPIRVTTSVYAQNLSCTVGQTNNFSPGHSEDMGQQTDRIWYHVQADNSVRSAYDGSGSKLLVQNACN